MPIDEDKEGTRFNLHHACMIGDGDMTRRILISGTNPNIQDIHGYTALHYAFKTGQHACISHLLSHSEDPIALLQLPIASNDGTTPLSIQSETSGETVLHFACKWKDEFVLQVLLQSGADPNVKDNSGLTPLMSLVLSVVVSSSTSDMVDALHSYGCNLNAALEVSETNLKLQSWNGRTALHMAVGKQPENVDADCIKSLISCGASIQATDAQGRTPLHIACIEGYFDNLDLLAPNKDYFQIKDSSGCMPLYYVCRFGHCEYFRKILSHSPKNLLQVVNTDGATPLTVVDEDGRTILHHACREGHDDVTIDLLEADADPTIKDNQGYTPLHYACENGHDKCVQAIFYSSMNSSGLSEIKDANGRIPLHIACMQQQHHHLIRALEPFHEHFLIEDNDGHTPLFYICTKGNCLCLAEIYNLSDGTPGISRLLTANVTADGATPLTVVDEEGRTILHHACRKGYDDITIDLLEAYADPSIKDSQGYTPLHYACESGHGKCVQAIFSSTRDPSGLTEIKDANGRIPLHIACMQQHHDLIEALEPSHEHCLVEDNDGYTPLYYIFMKIDCLCLAEISDVSNGIPGISSLLTAKVTADGATPLTIVDEEGRAFIHHVCKKGDEDLTLYLLKAGADPTVQDSQGNTPLHYACEGGHIKCLNHLLDFSQNPAKCLNIINIHGTSALYMQTLGGDQRILHLACQRKDFSAIKRLLEAGANANLPDGFSFTPLMRVLIGKAVFSNDASLEQITEEEYELPESESSVKSESSSIQSMEGSQSFTMCKETKLLISCIELLILFGASLEVQDSFGRSALHIACIFGHRALLHLLAPTGDLHHMLTKDSSGCTPLFYLYNLGHCEYSRNILAEFPTSLQNTPNGTSPTHLTAVDKDGQTLLHYACREGNLTLTTDLLRAGTDPTVQDSQGNTPLHYVCERGNIHCLYNFIEKCSDSHTLWQIPNKKGVTPLCVRISSSGQTVLHLSCQVCDHGNLLKELLKAGADPRIEDNEGYTPLHFVCERGDIELLSSFLDCCNNPIAPLFAKNSKGTSPMSINVKTTEVDQTILHLACQKKDICVIKRLLEAGANANLPDGFGFTPLMRVLIGKAVNDSDVLEHLSNKEYLYVNACALSGSESSVRIQSSSKLSMERSQVLSMSKETKLYVFCIEYLTSFGASLEVQDAFGHTALHIACILGHIALLYLLVPNGDFHHMLTKDSSGCTPLYYLYNLGHCECSRDILAEFPITSQNTRNDTPPTHLTAVDEEGQTLLHYACRKGNTSLTTNLLEAGADPTVQDSHGNTPLHYVCGRDYCNIYYLNHFISKCSGSHTLWQIPNNKGVTPLCMRISGGQTVLHSVCQVSDVNLMRHLLKAGADPRIQDSQGYTPLHFVCEKGNIDFFSSFLNCCDNPIALLLAQNNKGTSPMSINVKTTEGDQTILHLACQNKDICVIKRLLEAGANANLPDGFGFTPLMRVLIGKAVNGSDVLELLPKSKSSMRSQSSSTLSMEEESKIFVSCIEHLISSGASLKVQDAFGRRALHIACIFGHSAFLHLLAPNGDFRRMLTKDSSGCTPLYYLYSLGHCECSRDILLAEFPTSLQNRPNDTPPTHLTAVDEEGQTLLHYVCRKALGNTSLTTNLLEAGADPTVQDSQGNTPLHYVCERNIYGIRSWYNFINRCTVSRTLWQIPNSSGITPLSMQVVGIGGTMLHLACEEQDFNLIRKLLEAGADPNAYDTKGFTPLMRVITINTIADHVASDIVTILCEFNCNITLTLRKLTPSKNEAESSTQIWEGTALHMAVKVGSKPLCVQTLTAKCTTAVVTRDVHGRIPLHIATLYGHHSLINFLACHPEYLHVKDNNGCTPLYYACKGGNYQCIHKIFQQFADDVILDHCIRVANCDGITPLTVKDTNGKTILHHALRKGDGNLACKLLRAGADPTEKDHSGITPLTLKSDSISTKNRTLLHHLCCEEGNFDFIVKILKVGADITAKDDNGYTPLVLALRYINDTEASRILLAFCDVQHDEIRLSDCFNLTLLPHSALHIATEYNKATCVELLIAKGADLLADNSNGKNPLHIACIKGYSNLVGYLLTDKSIEVKDITGSTPLHYACKYGHIECVRKIIRVMENDHLKALFQMTDLEGITPLEGSNSQGETILHHTCAAHDLPLVQDLLRYGACPNAQDNADLTPLMTALKVNQTFDSEKLLQITKTFTNLVSSDSVSWDPHIKDRRGWTVLHYAAKYEDVSIAYALLVAGCDTFMEDIQGRTFSNLMPKKSLQLLSKQLLRIDRRQIVCVIGYPKSGKTTLIAAFKQVPRSTLQKVTLFFQNDRISLADTRTAGIDTTTFLNDKLGNIIFFDFAGQSEYYASHLTFLESALAPKGAAITFIMVVNISLSEDDKFRQCMEWLFPVKSIVKEHNILNVVLIGSHQDQLKSGASTAAKRSLYTTMQKLKTTLSTPGLQFVDCWGMDCRRLSSKGMARLQEYLKSRHSWYNSDEGRHAPLGASLLFHKLKNSDNPPLAITPCMIIDRLKDGYHPFPLTVKYIDRCCQDLSAAGIALYFLDREDAGKSWLILEIEEILGGIHGKLFAPDHSDFPMHHKNLANQFGLVQTDELKVAFKHSPLDSDMVQRLLISMEFCHPIDSSLMKEGANSTMHIGLKIGKDVVEGQLGFFLNKAEFRNNWLFFPSLVKVDRGITMSMEFDVSPEDCHSVCWELSTVTPHFLTPRFQQAIFIRLACNYVQKHKSVLSSVEEHSCTVSKNAMSWSTIHGVDVCVQIKYKSTVNVTARSRPGVKVSFLMELIANVVSDILTARANHSPGVDVFSVLRVMDKGTPTDHTVPISSIIASVEENGSHVNCREQPLKLISLKDLFLDWEVSTTLLKKMNNIMGSTPSKMKFSTALHAETPTENEHTQQSTDDVNQSGPFKGTSC